MPTTWPGPAPGSSSVKVNRVVSAICPVPIGAISKERTAALSASAPARLRTSVNHSGVTSEAWRRSEGGPHGTPRLGPGLVRRSEQPS